MPQPSNICRCCLVEGCYKDISTEYFWSGQKEVYADMLMDTFNITISYQEGGGPSSGSRLICDACIHKIREATDFKRRVLQIEKNIVKHLVKLQNSEPGLETLLGLKIEEDNVFVEESFPDGDDDRYDVQTDHISSDNYSDLDLKDEIDEDAMGDYNKGEGELFMIQLLPGDNVSLYDAKKTKTTLTEQNGLKKKSAPKKKKKRVRKSKQNLTEYYVPERRKPLKTPKAEMNMRDNTVKIILNSNVCPFKSLKIKFQCFYCKEKFFEIKQLKEHTLTHTCDKDKGVIVGRASSFKNAEITNLSCKHCSRHFDDIESLMEHLTDAHEIQFHPEGHLLVPFKIENELQCVICGLKFNTFCRLIIHMNSHYKNHVCETCGVSFINKASLRLHVASLHKERKCGLCLATFNTLAARLRHIIKVHDASRRSKRYCLTCNKTFKYTYLLHEHRIQEHGVERVTATCEECNKTFTSPNNLKIHIRSVHLKERNYPCTFCTCRFFTSTDQKRHERTHSCAETDLFVCSYCDTKFKSKDSWRRHTNKQHARLF